MPVTVQCFHCNAILELDDGFRGGVCRCSTCGSLLQVPRGDDPPAPPVKKVRPAIPPSPTSPTTPVQNATSSKLDVGISRGQFDGASFPSRSQFDSPASPQVRRNDIGMSSGLNTGRIHPTTPIAAAPARPKRKRPASSAAPAPEPTAPVSAPAAPRPRTLLWLGLLLAVLIIAVLVSLVIYWLYFYEPPLPFPMRK